MGTVDYRAYNREERHYCAVLMHALLSDRRFRRAFTEQLGGVLNPVESRLSAEPFEVFVEAAVLRDYWHTTFPSPEKSVPARLAFVTQTLEYAGFSDFDPQDPVFWTGTPGQSNVWFPGKWRKDLITPQSGSPAKHPPRGRLKEIQEAFNSIPDMLFLSGGTAVFVEAKVESPLGENQLRNMYRMTRLLRGLHIPGFERTSLLVLSRKQLDLRFQDDWDSPATAIEVPHLYWKDLPLNTLDPKLESAAFISNALGHSVLAKD